jgi:hypothetical protein
MFKGEAEDPDHSVASVDGAGVQQVSPTGAGANRGAGGSDYIRIPVLPEP